MTKFDRAVYGVLELVDSEIITFSRAAEVLGLKIMPLRAYALKRPKKSVIQADREKMMTLASKIGAKGTRRPTR
jgi:predicted HTH domain antitoxin